MIQIPRVRRLFADRSKSAGSAFLRREIAARMRERLTLIKLAPQCILDAGCGDGADLSLLQQQFTAAQVLGVDLQPPRREGAPDLLGRMRGWFGRGAMQPFIAADFAALPLADATVDLLWSNLALHWHPSPQLVFNEWRRMMRTGGLLMFSCFGPDTLKQVRQAFAAAGMMDSVVPFTDMHDLGDMLGAAGFGAPVMDMEMLTVTYDELQRLISDVRAFGGNPLASRRHGLVSRRKYEQILAALQQTRGRDGKYGLTFEVIYGHAFCFAPRRSGEAVVQIVRPGKARSG